MEAPHLNALQKKYADKGLVVLAVNAWNDPKSNIARYMRDNRLSYRVLLNGVGAGEWRRHVIGLPANFWINKEGIVVHQLPGFNERDVKQMERWIEEML